MIDFINVDYKVTLRIDGVDVITSTPQEYAPDVRALRDAWEQGMKFPQSRVTITAAKQQSSVSHISLWRNIYYTNNSELVWGTPKNPVQLGSDEYFVMGDNSLISADARYWDHDIKIPSEDLDVKSGRRAGAIHAGQGVFRVLAGGRADSWSQRIRNHTELWGHAVYSLNQTCVPARISKIICQRRSVSPRSITSMGLRSPNAGLGDSNHFPRFFESNRCPRASVRRCNSRIRCWLSPCGRAFSDSQSMTARSVRPSRRANLERGMAKASRSEATGFPVAGAIVATVFLPVLRRGRCFAAMVIP